MIQQTRRIRISYSAYSADLISICTETKTDLAYQLTLLPFLQLTERVFIEQAPAQVRQGEQNGLVPESREIGIGQL